MARWPYGSVSAGREKWLLNCIFFKVEGSYGQTKRFWWLPAICTDLSWLVHASEVALDPSFQIKPLLGHPELDPFFKFYCYFNALVRPNLQRWTEFGLLIIFWLNSDDFPFFYFHSSPSLSRDMPNWSLAWNFHHFEKFSYRNTDCRSEKYLKRWWWWQQWRWWWWWGWSSPSYHPHPHPHHHHHLDCPVLKVLKEQAILSSYG